MPRWSLSQQGSDGPVRVWDLEEGVYTLGSDATCPIQLEEPGIAPRHAQISLLPTHLEVQELHPDGEILVEGYPISGIVEVPYPATLQLGSVLLGLEQIESPSPSESSFDAAVTVPVPRRPPPTSAPQTPKPPVADLGATIPMARVGPKPKTTLPLAPGPSEEQAGETAPVHMEYRLRGEIARGGMGRIFEGEDPMLHRQVAVKVSSAGLGRSDLRFAREAEVLALLAHPNIVPVYNLGNDSHGRPFYSMKLVKGRTLQAIILALRDGDLETCTHFSLDRLLTIFRKVCDALAFAHSKHILHRDLKPENVMVGEFGEVLVMDWGLAKVIGEESHDPVPTASPGLAASADLGMTLEGDVMGTPQYMSPEQAEGRISDLDHRSDLYSLGAILYAILTLRAPVEGSSLEEVLTKVRNGTITSMTEVRGPSPRKNGEMPVPFLGNEVPSALRAVTLKAMALRREDRYQSVGALMADIEAYQTGFATGAEKAGLAKQLLLLIRRNKGAFSTAAAAALLLCSSAVWFISHLRISERKALESEKVARKNAIQATANENKALQEKESARRSAARAQIALAEAAEQELNAEGALRILNEVPGDLRPADWKYLRNRIDAADVTVTATDRSAFLCAVPSPVPKSNGLVTLQRNGVVSEVDTETGAIRKLFQGDASNYQGLAVSKKGPKLVFTATRTTAGKTLETFADVRSFPSGEKLAQIPLASPPRDVRRISLNHDGSLLLLEGKQKDRESLQLWNLASGQMVWEIDNPFDPSNPLTGELSDSGKTARIFCRKGLSNSTAATGEFFDVDLLTGAPTGEVAELPFPFTGPRPVANGHLYLTSGDGGSLFTWNGSRIRKINKPSWNTECEIPTPQQLLAMAFAGKEQRLMTLCATSGTGAALQFWDASRGRLLRSVPLTRPYGGLWILAYHPQANAVALLKSYGIRIWKLSPPPRPATAAPSSFSKIRILDDASNLLFSSSSGLSHGRAKVLIQKLGEPTPVTTEGETEPPGQIASTNRDASRIACAGSFNQRIRFFQRSGLSLAPLPTGKELTKLHPLSLSPAHHPILSPSGNEVWQYGKIYRVPEGNLIATTQRSGWEPSTEDADNRNMVSWVNSRCVAEIVNKSFSANQNAADQETRFIILWDASSGAILKQVAAPAAYTLSTSPDGRWIAEAGRDKRIRIRDAQTLVVRYDFRAHESLVNALEWHASKPYLVSASEDGTVKIWEMEEKTISLKEEIPWTLCIPEALSLSPSGAIIYLRRAGSTEGLMLTSTFFSSPRP
ncbi:MAG: hypothetical protein RLZZ142_2111 [Verrucomicrobiota bacterium]